MKNRRPLIYLGIVIFAALIIIALENPFAPRVSDVSEKYFIKDYDSVNVVRIEVEQLIDGTEIKRKDDGWIVAERITPVKEELYEKEGRELPERKWYPADLSRVTSALGGFGGLEEGIVVSTNPEKQRLYQTNAMGLHVRGFDREDGIIFDIIIGKNGPDFSSSYIRRANEKDVRLVNRNLLGLFSPQPTDWRNRVLWHIAPNSIEGIEVESKDGGFSILRDEGTWTLAGSSGAMVDEAKVQKLLRKISTIQAKDFADDATPEQAGLSNPQKTLTLTMAGGSIRKLMIGNENKSGRYHAKLGDEDQTYLISKNTFESIPTAVGK